MIKNVIIISSSFWTSKLWFRRQHFAKRFSDSGWRVLYVNPSFTILRPFFKKNQIPLSSLKAFLKDQQINENLRIITPPPTIPLEGKYPYINYINKKLLSSYIEYKAKVFFNQQPFILICYNPFDSYLNLNAHILIYECVDKHTAYPTNIHITEQVERAEKLLIKNADIVTVTTPSLIPTLKSIRDDFIFIPNGVDVSLYFNTKITKNNLPENVKKIKKPIIIYIGAIYNWFNLPLVLEICEKHPEWSILLIGPEQILSGIKLPKNLIYLGIIDRTFLPIYLNLSEIGIIPFIQNELTLHINPLKLYEYFACGLTCVSSFIYELKKFEQEYVLEIADNNDKFIHALEKNIGKRQLEYDKKIKIALEYSWDNIFYKFQEIIISKI